MPVAEYKKTIRCRDHENGRCRKGRRCDYKHLLETKCIYFERGNCERGNSCFYRHIKKTNQHTTPNLNIEKEKEIPAGRDERQSKEFFRKDERKIDPKTPPITQLMQSQEFMDHMRSLIVTIIGQTLQM